MQRILLVDDEPTIREALRERFEREGFHVSAVAGGEPALDLLLGRDGPGAGRGLPGARPDAARPGRL